MDLKKIKATNQIVMEAQDKFKPGDIVAYCHKDFGYNHVPARILGMVLPLDPEIEQIALFPQISVLVFESGETRLFWPSYLQLISAVEGEKT